MDDVDINKKLMSDTIFSGEKNYKYFYGYKDDDYKIKPLYITLPQMSGWTRSFNETKCMYFSKEMTNG